MLLAFSLSSFSLFFIRKIPVSSWPFYHLTLELFENPIQLRVTFLSSLTRAALNAEWPLNHHLTRVFFFIRLPLELLLVLGLQTQWCTTLAWCGLAIRLRVGTASPHQSFCCGTFCFTCCEIKAQHSPLHIFSGGEWLFQLVWNYWFSQPRDQSDKYIKPIPEIIDTAALLILVVRYFNTKRRTDTSLHHLSHNFH